MILFTRFCRFTLVDGHGKRARVLDLAVDLSAGDHPPVTRIILTSPTASPAALPWELVTTCDWERRRLVVADLAAAQPVALESLAQAVFLKRDVLDALVLDLAKRRTARANDLWLRHADGQLLLRGVDLSARAVLRRLARGRLGHGDEQKMVDWRDVEFLRGNPQAANAGRDYHRQIGRLSPAEIARLSEDLPYLHATELLTLLPDPIAADALEAMSPERQLQVLEELNEDQAIRLLALVAPDAAADLFARLEIDRAKHYLEKLPEAKAARILELLRYPEDTAGGIMTNLMVVVPAGLTVAEARALLRDRLREPDFVNFVYVVDDDQRRRLLGVLTLRDLLTTDDAKRVDDVMRRDLETVDPLESAKRAAERVTNTHLAAIAVVGKNGRLVGVITIDAAVAEIAPPAWAAQAPRVFS